MLRRWLYGSLLQASLLLAAPTQNIDRVILVYAPEADYNDGFANSVFASFVRSMNQEGLDVRLINTDDIVFDPQRKEKATSVILDTVDRLAKESPSLLIIGLHGDPFPRSEGRDVTLHIAWGINMTYQDVAARIDANPNVKGVLLDACYGFCDIFRASASRGEGKLMASSSAQNKTGSSSEMKKLLGALESLVQAKKPVELGTAFLSRMASDLKNCSASTLLECSTDPKSLTVKNGLQNQWFTFGALSRSSLQNASGRALRLCSDLNPERREVFLPGVLYPLRTILREKAPSFDLLSQWMSFRCREDGTWEAEWPRYYSKNGEYFRSSQAFGEDSSCQAHRKVPLSTCRALEGLLAAECGTWVKAYAFLLKNEIASNYVDFQALCLKGDGENARLTPIAKKPLRWMLAWPPPP